MSENESRNERKKAENEKIVSKKGSLNKAYYWIIGILFIILFLLVIYIFVSSGDKVNLGDEEEANSLVQDIETTTESDSTTEETESTDQVEESEEVSENATEETDEELEDTAEEDVSVNENAPLDTGHAVDYNSGSADRVAIKEKVMQATGLGDDLIENWIGNNGPGRVTADVYSPDKSEVYRVYLQYGDGDWHVTSYESLNSIP